MTATELSALANSLATDPTVNTNLAYEYLSDALIRIHKGWVDGAHSELSDTDRRRRIIGNEIPIDEQLGTIVTPISHSVIRHMLHKAAKAGLTEWQQEVWLLADIVGWKQREIAREYGVVQSAVSQCLNRARQALWDYVDRRDPAIKVFLMESRRMPYFAPAYRPGLPPELDEARQAIESARGVSTHVQVDALKRVEVWHNGKRPMRTRDGRDYPVSLTYAQIIARAKKSKKLSVAM